MLKNVIEMFKKKYNFFVNNISKMDPFFDINFSSIESAIALAPSFTKCGRCRVEMKLLDRVNKLYCERCKYMYGLPRDSTYEIAHNCYCPLDNY